MYYIMLNFERLYNIISFKFIYIIDYATRNQNLQYANTIT